MTGDQLSRSVQPADADADAEAPGPPAAAAVDADPAGADLPWRRLAAGMLFVEPVRELIKFIPLLIALIFAGRAGESGPPWGLIGTAAVIALGISRWVTTRYRITQTVIEVRRGLLQRKHLTVPRDRVRTVDVSAHPLQRLLGLVKVQIGTGTTHHGAEALALDGLRASAAGPLRAELLHRDVVATSGPAAVSGPAVASGLAAAPGPAAVSGPAAAPGPVAGARGNPAAGMTGESVTGHAAHQPVGSEETELARLDPRWIWYAPATLSGVVTAALLIGLGWRILNEAQLDPAQLSLIHAGLSHLRQTPLWVDIVQGSAVVLIVVTVLSVAGYVLSFWGFRLARHPGGTLQVSRGLLTTRSTSIEERRLRGVQRVEPLLLRAIGGARLQAIVTGLRERGNERGGALLVPPAPLHSVVHIETAVLGSAHIADARLIRHGPAARRRRYSRAVGLAALLVGAVFGIFWWTGRPLGPAAISLALLPVAALLAADRYRNLGHVVVDNRLITRVGSLVRRRSVLALPGVVGLTIRQSIFQRRSGLVTLTATTAAGAQHYAVPDVSTGAARQLAAELLPESRSFLAAPAAGPGQSSTAVLRDEPRVSRLPPIADREPVGEVGRASSGAPADIAAAPAAVTLRTRKM